MLLHIAAQLHIICLKKMNGANRIVLLFTDSVQYIVPWQSVYCTPTVRTGLLSEETEDRNTGVEN